MTELLKNYKHNDVITVISTEGIRYQNCIVHKENNQTYIQTTIRNPEDGQNIGIITDASFIKEIITKIE